MPPVGKKRPKKFQRSSAFPKMRSCTFQAKQARVFQSCLKSGSNDPAAKRRSPRAAQGAYFDSSYDSYKGVVANIRVMDGSVKAHEVVRFTMADAMSEVIEVGVFPARSLNQQQFSKQGRLDISPRDLKK